MHLNTHPKLAQPQVLITMARKEGAPDMAGDKGEVHAPAEATQGHAHDAEAHASSDQIHHLLIPACCAAVGLHDRRMSNC